MSPNRKKPYIRPTIMAHFRQAILVLDQKEYLLTPGKINSFEQFYVDFQREAMPDGGTRYAMFIHPKQDVLVEKIEIELDVPLPAHGTVSTFGLRSSDTCQVQVPVSAATLAQHGLFKGDAYWPKMPTGKGLHQSWTYMGLHTSGQSGAVWAASLNESVGFTALFYDYTQQLLHVRKDVGRGLRMTHSFPAMEFYIGPQLPSPELTSPPFKATALLLEGAKATAQAAAFAQNNSDDALPCTHWVAGHGWAPHYGDWLANPAIQGLPAQVRPSGVQAGITLSPFAAGVQSELARRNPDWLLRHNGAPLVFKAANGSDCHALDVYHGGVREYLNGVFHLLGDRCGFSMFVLEDLYAACLVPKAEKTRGQMMHEAAQLLRQAAGQAKLVAAQVPLGHVAGHFDAVVLGQKGVSATNDQWQLHKNADKSLPAQTLLAAQQLRHLHWGVASQPAALWPTRKPNADTNAQHSWLVLQALLSDVLFLEGNPWAYPPELRGELDAALELHRAEQVQVTELQPTAAVFKCLLDQKNMLVRSNWGAKGTNFGGIMLNSYETL